LSVLVIALSTASFAQPMPPLQQDGEIPLPNVQGRIDHLSIDTAGQRLFVSALGNGTVEVIDLRQGRRIHEITGLNEPQGVLYVASSNRLFVASDGDGSLRSFDGVTFAPLKVAELGDDADNLRYDPQSRHILVGYASGGIASFDADLRQAWNVRLAVHPESFQIEPHGSRIFVNLPQSASVAVLGVNGLIRRWPVTAAAENFPMALDEVDNRLFIGCRKPARLLVLDTSDGHLVAQVPIVGDTDDIFYDSARHRIYVVGGEGRVDVIRQDGRDKYQVVDRIITSPGARTGLFVPALNRFFVAAPHRGSTAARILVYRVQ
jgi:DNA-binding beta-propeller fold protein YncE